MLMSHKMHGVVYRSNVTDRGEAEEPTLHKSERKPALCDLGARDCVQ